MLLVAEHALLVPSLVDEARLGVKRVARNLMRKQELMCYTNPYIYIYIYIYI